MVDLRSEQRTVELERRKHARLELHCDATVLGLEGTQKITDISLGGIFIETKIPEKVKIGQTILINTILPSERKMIRFKAKIVSQTKRGIGCQFISLQEQHKDAICLCFELFKDTLPAECE